MRVNLSIQSSGPYRSGASTLPLSLTIRPSKGMKGDYVYATDTASLLRLLKRATDLPGTVLTRFEGEMYTSSNAKLLGVDLNDSALTDIGYFVD